MLVVHTSGQIVSVFKTALWFACRQTVEKLIFLDSFSLCPLSNTGEEKISALPPELIVDFCCIAYALLALPAMVP